MPLDHRNGPDTIITNDFSLDYDVLVYREDNHEHIGKWERPFKLIEINHESCKVKLNFNRL